MLMGSMQQWFVGKWNFGKNKYDIATYKQTLRLFVLR